MKIAIERNWDMCSVSVIVPLHNSIKYLQECIESILHQTREDIEIICVDSSTDGTTDMVRQYQKSDNRIRLIEDKNASYGHKINVGIRLAKGKYMAIVESDDYIAADMLENLYQIAQNTDVDFVKANFEEYIDTPTGRMFSPFNRLSDKDYNRVIWLHEEPGIMPYIECNIWTGIYRISFLREKGIWLNESDGASYQDTGFAILVTLMSQRVYFLKECYYKYRKDNEGSSVKADEKYGCIVDEYIWLQHRMEELGCNSEIDKTLFKVEMLRSFYWNYERLSDEYRKKFLCMVSMKDMLEDFDEKILDYEMPDKKMKLEILSGNPESRRIEEEKQQKKARAYNELLHILHNYRKVVIVCSGTYGQAVYRLIKAAGCWRDVSVCDNFVQGKKEEFDRIDIVGIEDAFTGSEDACFVIANAKQGKSLKNQLIKIGIREENIYLYENNFISSNVGVLYNSIKRYDEAQ